MGFTPWLYDLNDEAIDSTYSYGNGPSDVISHHLEEGVTRTEALVNKKIPSKHDVGVEPAQDKVGKRAKGVRVDLPA